MKKITFYAASAFLLLTIASVTGNTQSSFQSVQQKFGEYSRLYVPEKLYVHTDKDFYLAGEIAWFKIYTINGETHQPMQLSKVVYVEVLNRQKKAVLQAKVSMEDNGGAGSFYLPLTLSSDYYTLRAYTNWMKNFPSAPFFEKTVSIVNTVRTPKASFEKDSTAYVDFFPEGGHLVQDIETRLAFHITDYNGNGIQARGVVITDKVDTVASFAPQRFGIGSFSFKPVADQNYKAIIQLNNGKSITRSLPAVSPQGYVMNITDTKEGRLKVKVQMKGQQGSQRGEEVFLLVHTRQALKLAKEDYAEPGRELIIYVDKDKLGDGISHFTLFNRSKQPVCERLVFTRPKQNTAATISSDKNTYSTREKVNLSVAIADKDNAQAMSDLSVSVYQADGLQSEDADNILSYFWLKSDLQGEVESPGFYFTNVSGVEEAADNLMLTQGWRRFKWDNVLAGVSSDNIKFVPEFRGHFIVGKVTGAQDGKPAADITCFLSVPATPFGFYSAKTDQNGIVRFDVKNYYGPGEIILQARSEDEKKYKVDILTPFADNASASRLPLFYIDKTREESLLDRSIAMQAQNIYAADSIRKFTAPSITDTLPFYGRPEFTYKLADYKQFTTMEEVFREYVGSINVVTRNGKPTMSIADEAQRSQYKDNVLVLLDGVPLINYNKIFEYDPQKIKKLEIVPRTYIYGPSLFTGIASFETYQNRFDGFNLDASIVSVDYEGLQIYREFYSPSYPTDKERGKKLPDLRTTLHWVPHVILNEKDKSGIQFYTSDQPGKFIIIMEGISPKGEPVSASSSFMVQ